MNYIPPWDASKRWAVCSPLLEKAIALQTSWDLPSLFTEIINSRMHLWEIPGKAAFVTQIQSFPKERLCVIVLCGGVGMHEWTQDGIDTFTAYAKFNGCHSIVIVGRPGWQKIWPGFDCVETVMRRNL